MYPSPERITPDFLVAFANFYPDVEKFALTLYIPMKYTGCMQGLLFYLTIINTAFIIMGFV
jgi:hypothetical protein